MRISDWSSDVCSSDLYEEEENRDRANINDDQQHGDELRLQQNHKSRSIEERHDQPEHAVHRITREYRQRTAGDHQRGKQIKGQDMNHRSEEHTSELQSLMRISYAVFCLKKKKHKTTNKQ